MENAPQTPMDFGGRVVIVTGAGRGLGRAHALLLAQRGAAVVVNDVGGALDGSSDGTTPADALVAEIVAAGGHAVGDAHDVSTPESAAAIVETAIEQFGRVDAVVNNAGILRDRAFHNLEPGDMQRVIDIHLLGSTWVTMAAWPHFRDQGFGRVVMTSSVAGYLGNFGQANYSAAKAGLIGLTKALAIEGERRNIRVNAIAPGARTRMTEMVMGDLAEHMDPSLVSPVVAMLVHESCPISGEVLITGGGRVAALITGQSRGWYSDSPTPDSVLANLASVLDPADAPAIASVADEFALLTSMITPPDGR